MSTVLYFKLYSNLVINLMKWNYNLLVSFLVNSQNGWNQNFLFYSLLQVLVSFVIHIAYMVY